MESSDSIKETFSHTVCTCVYLYIPVCVTPAYLHSGTLEGKEKAEEITAWKQNQIKRGPAFVLPVSGVSRYLTINGLSMMIFCWAKTRKEEREREKGGWERRNSRYQTADGRRLSPCRAITLLTLIHFLLGSSHLCLMQCFYFLFQYTRHTGSKS